MTKTYKIVSEFTAENRWYRIGDEPHSFEEIPEQVRADFIKVKIEQGLIEEVAAEKPVEKRTGKTA